MEGLQIGRYHVLNLIGEGGMGMVYKARDTKLDRLVALKFLTSKNRENESLHQRIIQEAKITSSLEHPNICTIYDIGQTEEGYIFIAMAHYEGETLKERLTNGHLSINEILDITIQVSFWVTGCAYSEYCTPRRKTFQYISTP